MAEAFLGLKISVLLHSGIKLEGVVSQLEPSNQQMTLKDVTLYFFGQPPHYTPVYGVVGKDIKDLQVISNTTASSISRVDNHHHKQQPILDHHVLEQAPPPSVLPTPPPLPSTSTSAKSISKNRKLKQQQQQQQQQQQLPNNQSQFKNNNNNNKKDGWAREDVNIFREQEFDFQKNLDMFDKQKVFAEIRESDLTAPEELLVTLNRLPQLQKKLLPSENVLENLNDRIAYFNDEQDDFGDESDNDSQTPNEMMIRSKAFNTKKRRKSKQQVLVQQQQVKIKTKKTGIVCSVVSPLEMAHIEHECNKISNNFDSLLIENSARGTALLILQLLQQKEEQQQQHVVILVGNNKNGAIGLVTACHLINHGYDVTCCLVSSSPSSNTESDEEEDYIDAYQLQAKKFGVSIIFNLSKLKKRQQPVDFIVDAILGSEEKLIDLNQEKFNSICNMLVWTRTMAAKPVLSIDFPTGMDSSTGLPLHPEYFIKPNYTICLGAPKSGCKSRSITGELYLLDVGIPRLSWKKIGMKRNHIPWGADFLVALEYCYE